MNKQLVLLMVCAAIFFCDASENCAIVLGKNVGIASVQNKRSYQEDRHYYGAVDGGKLYAVYDGHGGAAVSDFLAKNLHDYFSKIVGSVHQRMVEAFKNADNNDLVKMHGQMGSTASIVYIKDNVAHFAHVGDSRALLIEEDGYLAFATEDHKPLRYDEKQRIEKAQGLVFNKRVNGFLAVSRSFGDYDIGKKLIISHPEYTEISLTKKHKFLVVASDGLWDKMSNEEVVSVLKAHQPDLQDMNLLATMLAKSAVDKRSTDNITVMLIDLLS